jgi:hypothetical protein
MHDDLPPPPPPRHRHGPPPHDLHDEPDHVPPHLRHGPRHPHDRDALRALALGPRERRAMDELYDDPRAAEEAFELLSEAPPEFAVLAGLVLRACERLTDARRVR